MIERYEANIVYRRSFAAFVYAAFLALYKKPLIANWHIEHICYETETMVAKEGAGRLVVNLQPRSLKSFILSVCLPAWLLGQNPAARIVCASYSEDLAFTFSRECRALMMTKFYTGVFPQTLISRKKSTESEFETTRRGSRLATSVNGTLTGRGGDLLIVDDPMKAKDAGSDVALAAANEWFRGTTLTRQDDLGKTKIIVAMQRLHAEDLSGVLIECHWPSIVLPAIATEDRDYALSATETYHRPAGEVLQPNRDRVSDLDTLKLDIGSGPFEAQYQQNPTPAEGNKISSAWLGVFDPAKDLSRYRRIILSCDPAQKANERSDYTAIVVCGLIEKDVHILHVSRGHWTVMQMLQQVTSFYSQFGVGLAIIEDTACGSGLLQFLKEHWHISAIGRHPSGDKMTRLYRHLGRLEAGRVLLPKEAPWLAEFKTELLAFPNGEIRRPARRTVAGARLAR